MPPTNPDTTCQWPTGSSLTSMGPSFPSGPAQCRPTSTQPPRPTACPWRAGPKGVVQTASSTLSYNSPSPQTMDPWRKSPGNTLSILRCSGRFTILPTPPPPLASTPASQAPPPTWCRLWMRALTPLVHQPLPDTTHQLSLSQPPPVTLPRWAWTTQTTDTSQTLWLLAIGRRRFETIGWKSDVSPAMTSKRIFHLGHLLIHAGFMMKKLPKTWQAFERQNATLNSLISCLCIILWRKVTLKTLHIWW